jgi:membrane protein involved in colicin uptake
MSEVATETKGQVAYDASTAVVLAGQAQAALTSATDLVIDSPTMYGLASDELRNIKTLQKTVEERRTAITGPLNAALKAVNDLFRAPKDYLDKAEAACKRSMIAYTTEVERRAAEARRIAEEEARKERDRLAAEQREQERIAREAAEASARAQREAEEAAARGDAEAAARAQEEARQQSEAAQSAQAEAQAAAVTAEVITMTPAVAPPAKVAGISGRVNYTAQVDDLMTLIKAVAEGKAPIQCVIADEKFLGAQARAFKKAGPLYPGVTAVAERGLSARAA